MFCAVWSESALFAQACLSQYFGLNWLVPNNIIARIQSKNVLVKQVGPVV